ncbi:hypothetical protein NPIL_242501, partial [Nephila pilipes]
MNALPLNALRFVNETPSLPALTHSVGYFVSKIETVHRDLSLSFAWIWESLAEQVSFCSLSQQVVYRYPTRGIVMFILVVFMASYSQLNEIGLECSYCTRNIKRNVCTFEPNITRDALVPFWKET